MCALKSGAYFAQLIGVPFIAVMPRCTAKTKIAQIKLYGGKCHFVDHSTLRHLLQ